MYFAYQATSWDPGLFCCCIYVAGLTLADFYHLRLVGKGGWLPGHARGMTCSQIVETGNNT